MSQTNKERVDKVLIEHLAVSPEQITPDRLLVPAHDNMGRVVQTGVLDLGCDSLDIVELVMAFEEEFLIEIADAESDALNTGTVQDLYDLIDRKTEKAAA